MYQLNTIINDYFKTKKRSNDYNKYYIYTNYEKIVGKSISKNTKIKNIRNGVLYIHCRNSVWTNELNNLKEELIKKFNESVKTDLIKDIALKIGNIKSSKEVEKKIIKLSTADTNWIERTIENIPDIYKDKFKELLTAYKERCKK